ncbi:ThiF family adenylyltransferase [Saccharococcus caldoxylosilyticus]|uniref:THIF-type NAD/FAD binding fold domain-containing protein n=1 Tax=Parageobacillus caldoxylosilyticus NBRC 107762 TaxID=1220594 RepID=A0A023DKU3_9BACL|nr:ThiF family adenylyltransferase [Parageobacillus caldoxylosilyticus]MBB3854517.1 hypothetical protein [Parageobacillus caldoxylosilyticus]GAJ41661.1 hypothetical protein GCA01S_084_00040 [Parageobacillus caldoxylosilyticus NBRC 107762]
MDNNINGVKAELEKLGFSFVDETTAYGRVPERGDINGYYIHVTIELNNFPLSQPSITLVKINGKDDLYRRIPINWRHLDEIININPKLSVFKICCLHNWSAKREYNGKYIYERIYDWLNSNVTSQWNPEEDLPSFRVLPQYTNSRLYLSDYFIAKLRENKPKILYQCNVYHEPYKFKSGAKASLQKQGEKYELTDIDFEKNFYHYIPDMPQEQKFEIIKKLRLGDKCAKSHFFVLRLPRHSRFKTFYQLLTIIRDNINIKNLSQEMKNIPFIVMYTGDKGKDEVVSFITNRGYVDGKSDYLVQPLAIESFSNRPIGVDLTVGLLGVGSLGSEVASLLVKKDTRKILLSDFDFLRADNIGRHVLGARYLGNKKSIALANELKINFFKFNALTAVTDEEAAEKADILVVTVGNNQSFDQLAFNKLWHYKKPVIWAWTSPNNILQEIVITTPSSGCLNCYYEKIKTDPVLKQIQQNAKDEIKKYPSEEVDVCGNPHTISQMERMVFLATQIVSILSYYSKHGKFKFDYVNYYWGMDDIIPTPHFGYLEAHPSCFCQGG